MTTPAEIQAWIDSIPSGIPPGTRGHRIHSQTYKQIFQGLLDANEGNGQLPIPVVASGGDDLNAVSDALAEAVSEGGGTVQILGHAQTSGTIEVPNKCVLDLGGRGERNSLTARSGFAGNSLVNLGLTSDSLAFGSKVHGGILDCAGHCSYGIYSTKSQEQSGAFGSVITNWSVIGAYFDGAGNANVSLEDCEIYPQAGGATAAAFFDGTGGANLTKRLTLGVQGHLSESGLHVHNSQVTAISTHVENALYGIDCHADAVVVALGLTGGTTGGTVTSLFRQRGDCRYAMAAGIQKNGATNAVEDDFHGVTITDALVPFYDGGESILTDLQLWAAVTGTTPPAGGGSPLPLTPEAYVEVKINGVPRKIAYYPT